MTSIASIFSGLMDTIDGWAANVLTTTASDIKASAGNAKRRRS